VKGEEVWDELRDEKRKRLREIIPVEREGRGEGKLRRRRRKREEQ
jgi:hypothetical protein